MIQQIPLKQLHGNKPYRSSQVDMKSLQEDIEQKGLINPITVRDITLAHDRYPRFEVVDGYRRLACCRKLGHKQIMCNVLTISEVEASIIASAHYVKTTRKQYGAALRAVLKANPELTLEELSVRVKQPISKLKRWMRL
jgi:ParB-like chromosome segregation protein Spo0J